jgi:hypothetical protein
VVKFLIVLLVALAACLAPRPASACAVAFTFINGQVLTATNLNANPTNEVNCINNQPAANVQPGTLGGAGAPFTFAGNLQVNNHANQLQTMLYITSAIPGTLAAFSSGDCFIPTNACGPQMPLPYNVNGVAIIALAVGFMCGTAGSGTTTVQWEYTTSVNLAGATWAAITGSPLSFTTANSSDPASNLFSGVNLTALGARWVRPKITAVSAPPTNCLFYLGFTQAVQ